MLSKHKWGWKVSPSAKLLIVGEDFMLCHIKNSQIFFDIYLEIHPNFFYHKRPINFETSYIKTNQ